MASRLALLGELRTSRGVRGARPTTLALSGETCVVGYEDGAVEAWRASDVVSKARNRAEEDVTDAPVSPVWSVVSLNGSNDDRCPVDALSILPACLAHPAGAIAVAHGGLQVDVTGVGGYDPRPARIAILDLDTGAEQRALTLPMAWPDGGICPVSRLLPADEEGGIVAVSAARVYRTGEGRSGFQGSNATLAIWSGASSVPIAVAQAGPHHSPAIGSDPGELRRLKPGAPAPPGGVRVRLPPAPILAPFAGLNVTRANDASGGENVVIKAAHVVVSEGNSDASSHSSPSSSPSLHLCVHEWHLHRPSFPSGTPLRAKRLVEAPAVQMGGDKGLGELNNSQPFANQVTDEGHDHGVSAADAKHAGGAPCVSGWSWGLAASWKGSIPRAGMWRFGVGDALDSFTDQPSSTAALERCVAGVTARCSNLVVAPNFGRLFALTYDDRKQSTKLFVTRAGEASESASEEGKSTETEEKSEKSSLNAHDVALKFPSLNETPYEALDEDDSCPICLEVPGAGGNGTELYKYDLKTNPFANDERLKNVVRAKCCGAPFCVTCLRQYLTNNVQNIQTNKNTQKECPSCRDVDLFNATEAPDSSSGQSQKLGSFKRHKDSTAPWREISLDFSSIPRAFRERNLGNETSGDSGDSETPGSRPGTSGTSVDKAINSSLQGGLADDFLRMPSRSGSNAGGSDNGSNAELSSAYRPPDPHATPMADGKPVTGSAGLSADFFRVDKYGADLPPVNISNDFLRGIAPTDLVVSAAVGGPGRAGDFCAGDSEYLDVDKTSFIPNPPSFVGYASGSVGNDDTLVRMDREGFVICEATGVAAVLTKRGVALLDASETKLRAVFREE